MTGTYNLWLVALSWLVAFCVSYTALQLVAKVSGSAGLRAKWWLLGGALAMGTGIWSMHFIGMLAFSLPIPISYHIPTTLGSLLIAIAVSSFALAIASGKHLPQSRLALSAVLMGMGIAGMHYSGMNAIQIVPGIRYEPILFITSIAIAMGASYAALWIAFKLRAVSSRKIAFLLRVGAAAIMGVAITGMHYTGMAASRFALNSYCVGTAPNNSWLAITIACFALGLLAVTLVITIYDAYLDARLHRHNLELERAHAQTVHAASHDGSTGLPNRILFKQRLQEAIAQAAQQGRYLGVISIAVANFKSLTDGLGHETGDSLRQQAAERLKARMRKTDLLACWGADEFLLMLGEVSSREDAATAAAKILDLLHHPFEVATIQTHGSAALGISVFPDDGLTAESLLIAADAARHHASKRGHAYEFFNAEMTTAIQARLELENDLRQSLARQELELHYQPKISIVSGRVAGVEALLRWRRPGHGLVMPGKFIALAEETGVIVPIGEWALHEACRQARAWQRNGEIGPLRAAVNLSAQQFRRSNLLDLVQDALRTAELEPRYLELELTESDIMSNAEESARILAELSRIGVSISIDDFGTGYSSLSYLRRFPLDKLKIDRSFIRDSLNNREDIAIVRAIVSLAHSLKLKVIAEGVENRDQLEQLRRLGCDQYQGYYCTPPLRAEALSVFLQTRWSSSTITDEFNPMMTVSKLFVAR